jgi:hypothetical protein
MTAGKKHAMPMLLEADVAAQRILGALRRRPGVYSFPLPMSLMMKLIRWLPDWLVARIATKDEPMGARPDR